jgi:hypothetical protein
LTLKKKEAAENRIELTKDYSDAQTKMEKILNLMKVYTEKSNKVSL